MVENIAQKSMSIVGVGLVAATIFAGLYVNGQYVFDYADGGFLWYGAWRTSLGEVPIRDFQSYDPARYYWSAAFFKVFGGHFLSVLKISIYSFFTACVASLFLFLRNSVGKLAPGVDVRGEGGQVVYPGSVHPETGKVYRWAEGLSPDEVGLAEFPTHLLEMLASRSTQEPVAPPTNEDKRLVRYAEGALRLSADAVAAAPEGTRNHELNRAA